MARTAWRGVGIGALAILAGLLVGFWPLSRAGALVVMVSAVVVILESVRRRLPARTVG